MQSLHTTDLLMLDLSWKFKGHLHVATMSAFVPPFCSFHDELQFCSLGTRKGIQSIKIALHKCPKILFWFSETQLKVEWTEEVGR